jgi:hypothetical protein
MNHAVASLLLIISTITGIALPCEGQAGGPAGARYYPLALGNVWTYRVRRISPKAGDSVVEWRVTHADRNVYQVWPRPMQSDDEAMELAVTPDGIKEISSGTLILKFPVRAGDTWAVGQQKNGASMRTFRVLSADQPCSVDSLNVPDCVVIEDEVSAAGLKTVTTYAPDVGPVLYRYYQKQAGKESLVQTVTLTSHKFAGP